MKCVMILDDALSPGLSANTAAALGLSLGNHIPGLIGPDVFDRTGIRHKGITAVPIPILGADCNTLTRIYEKSRDCGACLTVIGFSQIARRCHSYPDYMAHISTQPSEDIPYQGICLYGPKKTVNSLCGQLRLLK